jgi:hypothetical protein
MFSIFLFSMLCLSNIAIAETVYVLAKSATLRTGTTSLSHAVATVPFGQALELIEKDDNWYKVQVQNGAVGWIYHNKVGATKPSSEESRLAALGKDFRKTQSSSITGTAGVRGLDEYSAGYAKRAGIGARHRSALDRMTNYRLLDRQVEAFLKSGRLGEYAE